MPAESECFVENTMNETIPSQEKPILVTGLHRSGSTWFAKILGASPQLGYIREPFHPYHRPGIFASRVPWYYYVTRAQRAEFRSTFADVLKFRYGFVNEIASLRTPKDAGRMVRDASQMTWNRVKGVRAFVKDPFCLFSSEWLVNEFDLEAGLLVRHPAAFVSSCVRLSWNFNFNDLLSQPELLDDLLGEHVDEMERAERESWDLVQRCALLWKVAHATALGFLERNPNWQLILHEKLSVTPHESFKQLMADWNLKFDDSVKNQIDKFSSAGNPKEAKQGVAHSLLRDSKANVENWKDRLTSEQIQKTRDIAGDVASKFYGPDDW